jgi:hypothetical protein
MLWNETATIPLQYIAIYTTLSLFKFVHAREDEPRTVLEYGKSKSTKKGTNWKWNYLVRHVLTQCTRLQKKIVKRIIPNRVFVKYSNDNKNKDMVFPWRIPNRSTAGQGGIREPRSTSL